MSRIQVQGDPGSEPRRERYNGAICDEDVPRQTGSKEGIVPKPSPDMIQGTNGEQTIHKNTDGRRGSLQPMWEDRSLSHRIVGSIVENGNHARRGRHRVKKDLTPASCLQDIARKGTRSLPSAVEASGLLPFDSSGVHVVSMGSMDTAWTNQGSIECSDTSQTTTDENTCVTHVKRTSTRRNARLQDDETTSTWRGVGGEVHGVSAGQKWAEERDEGHRTGRGKTKESAWTGAAVERRNGARQRSCGCRETACAR